MEYSFVQGVGDELIYAVGGIVAIGVIFPIAVYVSTQRNRGTQPVAGIHPESEENVRSTRQRLSQNQDNEPSPRVPNTGEITCPICLGIVQLGVETNCGHTFCGNCITTYWQHGTWLGAVRCPVCRQQVTLLLLNFTEEENTQRSPEIQEILNKINDYNRRFSGAPRPLMDYIRDLPTLLRHTFTEFFSVGGLIWMFRLRIIVCFLAAFLYFISPLDVIPEAVFGILGLLDDVFIVLLLAIYISIIYRQYVQNRAMRAAMNQNQAPQ